MVKISESFFKEVYNKSRQKVLSELQKLEETSPHDLRVILQRYFNDDQAAFDKNGVGKARQKGEVEKNIIFERDKNGKPIPLGRYCLQNNDRIITPFSKADFRQQFINEELPHLHNNVVGQDCCDASLEAFDDEGWVISNKDKR
jgi:hypothetical protein